MFAVQTGLSGRAAKAQASYLARERTKLVRSQQRVELARLRELLKAARKRRREALRRTVESCRRGRANVSAQVKALRERERARINLEIANLRLAARMSCSQRKERIRKTGGLQAAAERVMAERQLQKQLQRLERQASTRRARLTSSKERRQESDDEVRGNLPAELQPVWSKVKRTIKPGLRSTRTEAFLEWAEQNAEEVMALQYRDVDREVAALVRAQERLEGARSPVVTPRQRRALVGVGLASSRAEAKRRATAGGVDDFVPF